jgi:hypothetical protein
MENQQKKVQEVHVQKEKETLNLLQMYAGLYSAGASFSIEDNFIKKLHYGPNRKKNAVCSFNTFETKREFVLGFNGFVRGPNTTEFIHYCHEVGVSFTPMKYEIPHDSWMYGFMEDKIRVYRNEKTGRLSLHMCYSDEYVLQWYKPRFGGSVTQQKGSYRWKACDKYDILKTLSFLLKEQTVDNIRKRHMEEKVLSQMKESTYKKQN